MSRTSIPLARAGVVAVVVLALLGGACSSAVDSSPGPTTGTASPTTVMSSSPSAPTKTGATTTTTTTTTTAVTLPPVIDLVLPEIPFGSTGFTYRGGDALDSERVGPSLIAVSGDGAIHVADPVGNTIWSFTGAESSILDLGALDILNVMAMTAHEDELVLLEVFFSPDRQRLHRVHQDGSLIRSIDLPSGAQLEDGLSGVLIDDEERIVLLMEDGVRFAILERGGTDFSLESSIVLGGHRVTKTGPDLSLGDTLVTADLQDSLGGMRILGATADGTTILVREEVVSMSPIEVLATIEWYDPAAGFVGSARIPLSGQFISEAPGLCLTPDGRVLALTAPPEGPAIVELKPMSLRITAGMDLAA